MPTVSATLGYSVALLVATFKCAIALSKAVLVRTLGRVVSTVSLRRVPAPQGFPMDISIGTMKTVVT